MAENYENNNILNSFFSSKRKNSQEIGNSNKRERVRSDTTRSEEIPESSQDVFIEPDEEFTTKMLGVFADKRMQNLLKKTLFSPLFDKINHLESKIETLEANKAIVDDRMEEMAIRIDELEQRERECNILVSGVDKTKSKAEVANILSTKLRHNLDEADIDYIVPLREQQNDRSTQMTASAKPRDRMKVVMRSKELKLNIIREKKRLKGENIWITEDLTPLRNKLAYLARECVRKNKAAQSWVFDGTIFLKMSDIDRPQRVHHPNDIPM